MKRILCLLTLLLIITACDDGNLTVDVIDFSEVAAQKCSDKDVIYKIKDSEMLFIEIPAATFTENETIAGEPIEVPLSSTVKVTYRKYASAVTANNICGSAPDVTPNLVEQWNATDGIIQITATAIKTTDATTNATKITGYKYYIVFKNISFLKPDGSIQTYAGTSFIFGNYTTTISPLAFGFDHEVEKSDCSTKIYDFLGSVVFTLDVGADYNTLFANEVTTTPRTALINATHKLSYRLFSGPIMDAFFCNNTLPALTQQWDAIDGIEATSGIIEVTTTTLTSSSYLHTIRLKNVTLKKGNSSFSLGDDYLFGTLITP